MSSPFPVCLSYLHLISVYRIKYNQYSDYDRQYHQQDIGEHIEVNSRLNLIDTGIARGIHSRNRIRSRALHCVAQRVDRLIPLFNGNRYILLITGIGK